jgi:hypothetical protein
MVAVGLYYCSHPLFTQAFCVLFASDGTSYLLPRTNPHLWVYMTLLMTLTMLDLSFFVAIAPRKLSLYKLSMHSSYPCSHARVYMKYQKLVWMKYPDTLANRCLYYGYVITLTITV